jgi:hypothetical protein
VKLFTLNWFTVKNDNHRLFLIFNSVSCGLLHSISSLSFPQPDTTSYLLNFADEDEDDDDDDDDYNNVNDDNDNDEGGGGGSNPAQVSRLILCCSR